MNKNKEYLFASKRELINIVVYYSILLLIAMSWTERTLIQPSIVFRLLFLVFFALPLFIYRYMYVPVLAVFAIIRLFSVAPYGYLPSDLRFYFYLTLFIFFIDIVPSIFKANKKNFLGGSNKSLLAFLIIVLISNAVNLNFDYSFLFLLGSAVMLKRFVKSKTSISMLEIAFMVVTFCLSIYSFIFSDDFIVKQVINKDVIQRAFWTDPNYLGSIIAIGIIVSFFYFMNRPKDEIALRILFLTVAIMGYIVLGLLASRGAFLAAIVPTFYILYKKINSVKNFVFVALFVVVAVTALSSSGYFDGLIMRIASGDTTGSDRTIIWELSLNKFFQSDMPMMLLGGGTNYANTLVGKSLGMAIYSPHNNFLAVLYDYGIIGLFMFIYIFFIWITKNLNNVLLISLVLYFGLVCLTLVPLMYYPYCYLLVLFEGYVSYEEQRKLQLRKAI